MSCTGWGVRMLGVTYSESNQLGGGLRDPSDGGLTDFGLRAVTSDEVPDSVWRSTSRTAAT